MSKIAEEQAKKIAKKLEASQAYKFDNFSVVCGAIEGYDQAMQDFLEKACEWIEMKIICYSKQEYEELIDNFKNYMQDEM